jgi:hypothetical protein
VSRWDIVLAVVICPAVCPGGTSLLATTAAPVGLALGLLLAALHDGLATVVVVEEVVDLVAAGNVIPELGLDQRDDDLGQAAELRDRPGGHEAVGQEAVAVRPGEGVEAGRHEPHLGVVGGLDPVELGVVVVGVVDASPGHQPASR